MNASKYAEWTLGLILRICISDEFFSWTNLLDKKYFCPAATNSRLFPMVR